MLVYRIDLGALESAVHHMSKGGMDMRHECAVCGTSEIQGKVVKRIPICAPANPCKPQTPVITGNR